MGVAYQFVVRSEPRPQPRPRATRIGSRVRIYTPSTASLYKAAVQAAARDAVPFGSTPIESPIKLTGEFVLKRPKRLKKAELLVPHVARPDLDNLIKSTQDAIVDSGILGDDCIIWSINMIKRYADPEEAPHVSITLSVESTVENGKIME